MNKTPTAEKATYTLADVGCYVDGARGIYAIDAIVDFVRAHDLDIGACCDEPDSHSTTCFDSRYAGCEFVNEVEEECDKNMNAHYRVDGAYWGRNENGDWGLWANEQD